MATVVGTGTCSSTRDGDAATSATINASTGVARAPDGGYYVGEDGGFHVRKVSAAGTITTYAGTGVNGATGDGGATTSAEIGHARGLAVDASGDLYIAVTGSCRIRKVTSAGIISTIAGTGTCSSTGDGAAATAATLNNPVGIVGDDAGNLYVSEQSGNRVRRIDPNGVISTVAGTGTASSTGDGGAASSATLNQPYGLTIDQAGRLVVTEAVGHRVRRIG